MANLARTETTGVGDDLTYTGNVTMVATVTASAKMRMHIPYTYPAGWTYVRYMCWGMGCSKVINWEYSNTPATHTDGTAIITTTHPPTGGTLIFPTMTGSSPLVAQHSRMDVTAAGNMITRGWADTFARSCMAQYLSDDTY